MPDSANDIVIGEIEKKDKVLRYTIRFYGGHKYLDIRVFFKNGKGLLIPTKEGLTMGKNHLTQHMEFLNQARFHLKGEEPF